MNESTENTASIPGLSLSLNLEEWIYRQSLVKHQPENIKSSNFYVLTKVPHCMEQLKQEQKFPIHSQREWSCYVNTYWAW